MNHPTSTGSALLAESPLSVVGVPSSVEEFSRRCIPEPMSGCWLWLRGCDTDGYGVWWKGGGRAHRIAWRVFRGDPGPLHVLHKCDNPPCVNPDHLFLGTNRDNIQDCARKGRHFGFAQGRANPGARLSEDDVRALLAEHALGVTGRALALKYGITDATASRIIRGLSWRHLPLRRKP